MKIIGFKNKLRFLVTLLWVVFGMLIMNADLLEKLERLFTGN